MTTFPSKVFQDYAWFSVQVDQYYAATKIFARNYDDLKTAYSSLPRGEEWPKDFSCLSDSAKKYFVLSSSTLNYMGASQIFTEAAFPQLSELPKDMVNFGFYTCFCFQWTLFENFTKQSIMELATDGILPPNIISELQSRELRTRAFLKYIDDGHVFGNTPFTTVLPLAGLTPQVETCDFNDLDVIRNQRNDFIHAVETPSILPATEVEKERLYERSMWILRKFAENIDYDVQQLRSSVLNSSSGT